MFHSFNVKLLTNESARIRNEVTLIGFDGSFSGKPDRQLAEENVSEYCIAMIHSPALYEAVKNTCPLTFFGVGKFPPT